MEHLQVTRHTPEFRGNATEYFGIWIVNLVLSILTLGIYSAWAKVRTQRYMYSNTRLAGAPFEYLANPIQILKGRLIAYAFVIVLAVAAKFQLMWVVVPMYLLLLALYPLLIHFSLRFRARYAAWRGLRFNFDGKPGEAYQAYMLYPIVAFITMYLMIPWMVKEQQSYIAKHHSYGGRRFAFQGELMEYYKPFLISLGIGFALMMLLIFGAVGMAVGSAAAGGADASAAGPGPVFTTFMIVFMVLLYGGMLALGVFVRTKWTNLLWNNTSLGEHRFESKLEWPRMLVLYLTNGLAILASFGLLIPWAQIRMLRYRLASTTLVAQGSLDEFVGGIEQHQGAAGSELAQALDLDLDIAL